MSHSDSLPATRACLAQCGGVMQLAAFVKATGFGLYRCPKCKREALETAQPLPSDSTGQDIAAKRRGAA